MNAPTRVGYIGGFGRSGSTLLELSLGALPDTCALGEVVHLWERGLRDNQSCGCGRAFHDCPFWHEVGRRAFGGWHTLDAEEVLALKRTVDRNRFVPVLLRRRLAAPHYRLVQDYTDLYAEVYRAAASVSGAQLVLDSSKHVSLAACLRRNHHVDLRLVHVVRDSRGVAYSWSKRVQRPEISDRVEYMPRYSAAQAGTLWTAHNAMFEAVAGLGTTRLRVRYEDFVRAPRETLQRVATYLGLPDDTVADGPDHRLSLQPTHTVAGNPMRFTSGTVQVRGDDEWRTGMTPANRAIVTATTWPLLLRYGYRARPVSRR